MVRVRLSEQARSDLRAIWNYSYRVWGAKKADSYYRDLTDAVDAIGRNPNMARKLHSTRQTYMKYAVHSHFIVFRISNNTIDVVRILHSRMDTDTHLPDE